MMGGRPADRSPDPGAAGGDRSDGDSVGAGPEPPVRGLPAACPDRRLPGPAPRKARGAAAGERGLMVRVEFVVVDGPAAQVWRSRQSAAVRALLTWIADHDQAGGTTGHPAGNTDVGRV